MADVLDLDGGEDFEVDEEGDREFCQKLYFEVTLILIVYYIQFFIKIQCARLALVS